MGRGGHESQSDEGNFWNFKTQVKLNFDFNKRSQCDYLLIIGRVKFI